MTDTPAPESPINSPEQFSPASEELNALMAVPDGVVVRRRRRARAASARRAAAAGAAVPPPPPLRPPIR